MSVDANALLKRIDSLAKAMQKKIAKKAITAGVRVMAKAIKKEIPSSQKSARKAIGYSFKRPRSGAHKDVVFAKAGAGAGLKKKRREKMRAKQKGQERKKKGVGMGVSNVMWLLAGTEKRYTGSKRASRKKGSTKRVRTGNAVRYTGRMKRSGIVQRAEAKSGAAVGSAISKELSKGIKQHLGTS